MRRPPYQVPTPWISVRATDFLHSHCPNAATNVGAAARSNLDCVKDAARKQEHLPGRHLFVLSILRGRVAAQLPAVRARFTD